MREVALDYGAAGTEIRADLRAAHRETLDYLRRPGSWLSGAERNPIVEERG
jgi:hypothetical protein